MKLFATAIPNTDLVVAVMAEKESDIYELILQSKGKTGGRVFYFKKRKK